MMNVSRTACLLAGVCACGPRQAEPGGPHDAPLEQHALQHALLRTQHRNKVLPCAQPRPSRLSPCMRSCLTHLKKGLAAFFLSKGVRSVGLKVQLRWATACAVVYCQKGEQPRLIRSFKGDRESLRRARTEETARNKEQRGAPCCNVPRDSQEGGLWRRGGPVSPSGREGLAAE